nr:hypothetical protein BgiMline_017117 [Biomphalaria glabrata]
MGRVRTWDIAYHTTRPAADSSEVLHITQPGRQPTALSFVLSTRHTFRRWSNEGQSVQCVQSNEGQSVQCVQSNEGQSVQCVQSNEGQSVQCVQSNEGQSVQCVQSNENISPKFPSEESA